jgi:oxygen-independent coproporphyrinogen-3 oxidase
MYRLLKAGKIQPVQEETSTAMFALLIDTLTSHGFIHYEISAFGLPGFFSRHNIAYWQNVKYVGLGPAAHSYDGNNRSWNVASTIRYNQSIETDRVDREMEQLSLQEKYNEFILTGLRTMWGVDLLELKRRFGERYHDYCMVNAQRFIHQKLLTTAEDHLQLTREGIFISDGIMSELMSV